MNRIYGKFRRILCVSFGFLLLYLAVRIKKNEYQINVFLPKVHPNEPWEFVADFSNMKYLNPTILDFNIKEESGNYDHWKYTAEYSERLSHWPHLPNYATAHFEVRATPNRDTYFINSIHQTCLFMGFFCLDSESQFKFMKSNHTNGAICEETVIYQCPAILSSFCKREVLYQRNAIINNLKKKFVNS